MCTLLGRSVAGRWLLASTSDDPYGVKNHLICATTSPYPYIAVRVVTDGPEENVPWNGMLTRGLNAAGLGYTYAYVHQQGNEEFPSQQWAREALASCRDVAEAVALIQARVGHVLPGNYLLVDGEGEAASLAVSQTELVVTPGDAGVLVCTNFWQQLPMEVEDEWGAVTATQRSTRGSALLQSHHADPLYLFQATRDHNDSGEDAGRDYGVSICNHGKVEGTISSEILDPSNRRLWWTYGWPCGLARGYETPSRTPWGRYLAFDVAAVSCGGDVTTLDGCVTPLGVGLMVEVEGRG